MSVSTKALDYIVKHVHGLHDVFILERERETRGHSYITEKTVDGNRSFA